MHGLVAAHCRCLVSPDRFDFANEHGECVLETDQRGKRSVSHNIKSILRQCSKINVNLGAFDDAELRRRNADNHQSIPRIDRLPIRTVEIVVASNTAHTAFLTRWHTLCFSNKGKKDHVEKSA